MFYEWFQQNKQAFLDFGDTFVALLSDTERIEELASRDLEKVARIFKLIFLGNIVETGTSNEKLKDILNYLQGGESNEDV
ncbi:MAG: hypothetical protein FWG44_08985 [Oscillospiraceae bacterium]|nr:hypothetical protein [Oscillospiraceae bacterium]